MILYRPVGLQELELIYDGGMKAFPARLPQQPIFYPVLDIEYARKTASDWNAKSGQFAGYVTQFKVEDDYLGRFEKHTVGGTQHQEFWIPAEELDEFNRHITGHIKVVEAYFGESFQGFAPDKFGLQGKNAASQFTELTNSFLYKRMEFYLEIKRNHKAIFLNYPFWQKHDFKNQGLKEKVLQAVREAWLTSFPKTPLANAAPPDIKPVDDIDSPSSVDPVQADTSKKEPDVRSLAKPVRTETRPVEQPDPHFPVKPVSRKTTPVEKNDSNPSARPVPEETPPAKQKDSSPSEQPVHRETPPVKRTTPHFLVNRVPQDARPIKQTVSHFAQGLELGLAGKYQEAIDELSRAVEVDPRNVVARTSLGVAFHRLGEDDRALSCYDAVLKLDPRYAEAHYFRANILYSRNDVREAIAEYTIAIGLKPELIRAHEKAAPQDRLTDYTDSPLGMYQIAKHAFRILELNQLLENNPRQANLFKERASEYSRLGNDEQAIKDYDACLTIQPDDAAALHFRGAAYDRIGQPDRALKDYQQAATIDPQLSDVYINRGVEFGRTGQFRQSIESLTEGIRLAPTNPNGYFNRGATYLQLGDFKNAIDDFSKVIQLSSSDEDAYYWRGISHEEAGHRDQAIADYKQFLALSRNARAREDVEQRLSQWNTDKQDRASERSAVVDDRQRMNQHPSEKPDHRFDLYDLLVALGDRALDAIWLGSEVDCEGEKAEELYSLTDQNLSIEGQDFLQIASGVHQTIKGDFQAFDPGAASPWIFIRAWEGSGFYIETDDPKIKKRLKAHFQSIEDVKGASPPYEGLFIRS